MDAVSTWDSCVCDDGEYMVAGLGVTIYVSSFTSPLPPTDVLFRDHLLDHLGTTYANTTQSSKQRQTSSMDTTSITIL